MSNIETESRVAKTVPMTIAAFEPSLSTEERIARTRAALAMLSGIAEE